MARERLVRGVDTGCRGLPMVSGVCSGKMDRDQVLLGHGRDLLDGFREFLGRDQVWLDGVRQFSVRHFVEHLVCSTPGTVATGYVSRVWAPGLGRGWWASGFGLRFGLDSWAGSDFLYFYFILIKLIYFN